VNETLRRATFWVICAVVLTSVWQGSRVSSLGTPARALGLLAALLALASLALHGRRHLVPEVHVLMLLLVGWALLSVLWTSDGATTFTYATTLAQLALLVLIVWEFADRPGDVGRLMTAFVIGCALSAVGVITSGSGTTGEARLTANGFNENDLGVTLALGVPFAWYLAARTASPLRTALFSGYLVLGSLGVLLTGSRGALLVLVVTLALVPLGWRQASSWGRALVVTALVGGAVAAVSLVPAETFERLGSTTTAVSDTDLSGRVPLWKASLDVIEEHPLVGVGGGATPRAIEQAISVRESSHDTFLSIASGLGVVGVTLFVGILLLAFHRVSRLPSRERRFASAALLALVVALLPLHWELQKPLWIVLALLVGLSREHAPLSHVPRPAVPVPLQPSPVRSFA
jgi:O-antigen ligase